MEVSVPSECLWHHAISAITAYHSGDNVEVPALVFYRAYGQHRTCISYMMYTHA